MDCTVAKSASMCFPLWVRVRLLPWICAIMFLIVVSGCAHYPINQPLRQTDPQAGYLAKNFKHSGTDDDLLVMLTFSGGGIRAAAFSYGVLEALRDTEISIKGRKKRLLDEVDLISGVSGGSFTAAYYGLFGDRIFEDFESRFLKRDIQGDLIRGIIFNPVNWAKFSSAYYGSSDLAADYYDKHLFDHGTFGDILARGGPMIVINATDMTYGTRFSFVQGPFDAICSDLRSFSVARACAASSAVPVLLSPVTLRNYAGKCGYQLPPALAEAMEPPRDVMSRRFDLANNMLPFLDSQKKPYIHLVDGGVADNLGLRAVLEHITLMGDPWTTLKYANLENVHKIVFVVVNAETEIDSKWDRFEKSPPLGVKLASYSSISIARYNTETVALLSESFNRWADEIRRKRCESPEITTEPGSCGDIKFYLVEVKFDALDDQDERHFFKRLPTSFILKPEEVDKLREAARRILAKSHDFQQLIGDIR